MVLQDLLHGVCELGIPLVLLILLSLSSFSYSLMQLLLEAAVLLFVFPFLKGEFALTLLPPYELVPYLDFSGDSQLQ